MSNAETAVYYGYDALERLGEVQLMKRNGQLLTTPETTGYVYDRAGNRLSSTLPNGVYIWYDYNATNRLTEVVNYQTQPTQVDPNKPQLSRFEYGHYAGGHPLSKTSRVFVTST